MQVCEIIIIQYTCIVNNNSPAENTFSNSNLWLWIRLVHQWLNCSMQSTNYKT